MQDSVREDLKAHWESVYRTRAPTRVSWYQPEASLSLDLIRRVVPDLQVPIIDVGGGASTLVDGLLASGYSRVTVLDMAEASLDLARLRLDDRASQAHWIEADILTTDLPARHFGLWHDRAVFHFLTVGEDRAKYVAQVRRALRRGGHVIVATFATNGPERCSGLDVVRYSPESLRAALGASFRLVDTATEEHTTPDGGAQAFLYCLFRFEG